jgi:glutathione S-transferase
MAELEIIGATPSNYVWACRIACTEKGVPYRLSEARPHSPEIAAIHPLGKIPGLRHGDVTLAESRAICGYIDRTFEGPRLIPDDPVSAAQMEQWLSIVNTAIDPVWMRQYVGAYVFPGTADGKPDRGRIELALPAMQRLMAMMDNAVAATNHLAAACFTLADITFVPMLFYMSKWPESAELLSRHASLSAYLELHLKRPSVQSTMPDRMPGAAATAARAA